MSRSSIFLLLLTFILSCPAIAYAYLQHALRNNIVSCQACHYSPTGGGPRNTNGKLFGAHGFEANPLLAQEYVSADFRVLYYRPQKQKTARGGLGVMTASVAGHVSLNDSTTFVLEHNVAGFPSAPWRDSYVLFQLPNWGKFFDTVLIGRFRFPFGYVTDEHRTYTRVQTATEWYTMDTGAMFTGTPSGTFTYHLALVNGTHSSGNTLSADQADQWGGMGNVRWLRKPYVLGASAKYYDPKADKICRVAWTVYAGMVFRSWFWLIERTEAKGFNGNLGQGFATAGYASAITADRSEGWLSWLEWGLNPRFALVYKFDLLTPDADFRSDNFERHGLGFRWTIAPNVNWQARAEWARATQPSEKNQSTIGAQNSFFTFLQVAL